MGTGVIGWNSVASVSGVLLHDFTGHVVKLVSPSVQPFLFLTHPDVIGGYPGLVVVAPDGGLDMTDSTTNKLHLAFGLGVCRQLFLAIALAICEYARCDVGQVTEGEHLSGIASA